MSAVSIAPHPLHAPRGRRMAWRPALTDHRLAFVAGLYLSLTGSAAFWREAWATGQLTGWTGAWTVLALALVLCAVNTLLMALLLHGRAAKAVLTGVLLLTAVVAYFSWHYTVYLDDDMLRNVLHTDAGESRELLNAGLWLHLAVFAGLPIAGLWRTRIVSMPGRRRWLLRVYQVAIATVVLVLSLAMSFKSVSGLMHTHRDLRHLVAPANALVSMVRVATHRADDAGPLRVVGADARALAPMQGRKPRTLVIVVGETLRARNWGLSGYARQTTPRLAAIGPVNFTDVTSCGTATEVSLPCMFAPVGRRDYDQDRIRHSESLLHVLQRAGIATAWRDNQTGCKGVCDGLPFVSFRHARATGACSGEDCLDRILLRGLPAAIDAQAGDQVVVLHPLGNHGPSYYKRYPRRLARFVPACRSDELSQCSLAEIVNAYDNAVLQTDDLLGAVIALLSARRDRDTAMLFVSDHGESLGENGLFLHGMPYAVAPRTQTHVPMVLWTSPGFARARALDIGCMRRHATRPASHDHLFHTVLGLMQVGTRDYAPDLDLTRPCIHGAGTAAHHVMIAHHASRVGRGRTA